jgi:hypothetical protein
MLPARRGAWRLLHDSACDGGVKHAKFHELCDGKGARVPLRPPPNHLRIDQRARAGHTVVVLKDKNGNVYGGHIDGVWTDKGFWNIGRCVRVLPRQLQVCHKYMLYLYLYL